MAAAVDASQAGAGIRIAIRTIEAAAWLLDQIHVGDLSDLSGPKAGQEAPACWLSTVRGSKAELGSTLERWAIRTISDAVQEIRDGIRIVAPKEAP